MTAAASPDHHHPSVQAGLLMLLREVLPADQDRPRTLAEIEAHTGVSRAWAYEVRDRLRTLLPAIVLGRVGREKAACPPDRASEVLVAVRDFLMAHPGAVTPGAKRHYSPGFVAFVLGLMAPGAPAATLTVEQVAALTGVPYGTLKQWILFATARPGEAAPDAPAPLPSDTEGVPPRLREPQ